MMARGKGGVGRGWVEAGKGGENGDIYNRVPISVKMEKETGFITTLQMIKKVEGKFSVLKMEDIKKIHQIEREMKSRRSGMDIYWKALTCR